MPIDRFAKRKFEELRRRVEQEQTDLLQKARRLLPLSRGGRPPVKSSKAPRQATPLQSVTIPSFVQPSIGSQFKASAALRPMKIQEEVNDMNTQDIVREMVNDPMITITPDMLPIINDPGILMDFAGNLIENQFSRAELIQDKPKKRKVSKYQKELGRQLKLLKKKHPRTPIKRLMKKAHTATRKALSK